MERDTRVWTVATGALLVTVLAVMLTTYGDYGLSWDEPQQSDYGRRLLRYYASGGVDDSHARLLNNYLYGGFFTVLDAVAVRLFAHRLGEIETSHLFTAVFGWSGLLATAALGVLIGGSRVGFAATLFLVLMPTWYGHLFNNPKDVPFGVMSAWSLVAIVWLLRSWPRLSWRRAFVTGLAVGCTMGIRIAGLILIAYLAGTLFVLALQPSRPEEGRRPLWAAIRCFMLASAIAYVTMLACWPWAAESPAAHPLEALRQTAEFQHDEDVLYGGVRYLSTNLPWHYLPGWLLIQTPEVTLVALALGMAVSCAALVSAFRRGVDGRQVARLVPLLAATVPIVLFFVRRPVVYDAARHFLFLLPAMAVLAAVGVDALARPLSRRGRVSLAALIAAGLVLPLEAMATTHPYEYVYFNALVGGLRGAEGRYDLDYWSHSFREATLRLQAFDRSEGRDAPSRPRIYICGPRQAATPYFPLHWVRTSRLDDADFAIVLRRHSCNRPFRNSSPLLTVERHGVVFAYVYDQARRRRKERS